MTELKRENLYSRWSRRKLQSKDDRLAEDLTIELEQKTTTEEILESSENHEMSVVTEVDTNEQPVLTDADMPDIDSLHEDSDFSVFMSSGVSDKLRNLALKKMFKAPVFNIRDGLDEYDEDYTSFEKLGDIVTCDMKHQIELEAQKKLEQEQQALEEQALQQEAIEAEQLQDDPEDVTEDIEAKVDEVEAPDVSDQQQTDHPQAASTTDIKEAQHES